MDGERSSRRRVMLGAAAVGAAALGLAARGASGQDIQGEETLGDCSQLEGLQLLLDWRAGKPVLTHDEILPPGDWQLYTQPNISLSFLYPPGWSAYALTASQLTRAGAIAWQETPSPTDYLAAARIVSPDRWALYEYVSGGLIGVALTVEQAALAAEQAVLGDGNLSEPICQSGQTAGFTRSWLRAGSFENLSVVTSGNLIVDGSAPYSSLAYQSFVSRDDRFTEMMRTVYIPIMYQFLMSGTGSSPDPTPTPEF